MTSLNFAGIKLFGRFSARVLPRTMDFLFSQAKNKGLGIDKHPNESAVRRYASPIIDQLGVLRGIVALAESPAGPECTSTLMTHCQQCAADIAEQLSGELREIHR